MHPTGSHARSSDVILRSCYAYSWHINPWPAGDLKRSASTPHLKKWHNLIRDQSSLELLPQR